MSKQQDLIKVFEFISEFLKEPELKNSTQKDNPLDSILKVSKAVMTKTEENDAVKLKNNKSSFKLDKKEILNMMSKVDKIDKQRDSFDEPLLRKRLPDELRDTETESTGGVRVSLEPTIDFKTGETYLKSKIDIVKD